MDLNDLTPGELAELKTYNSDLAAEIEGMDEVELALLAKRADVDLEKYPKKEALVAAIKDKASIDFAQGKLELRKMTERENRFVDEEDGKRSAQAKALRALNVEFCRAVPEEAWSGTFSPSDAHPRFGGEYPVANGKYRVPGSDWIFEIKGKRLISAYAANASNQWGGKGVIAVE